MCQVMPVFLALLEPQMPPAMILWVMTHLVMLLFVLRMSTCRVMPVSLARQKQQIPPEMMPLELIHLVQLLGLVAVEVPARALVDHGIL